MNLTARIAWRLSMAMIPLLALWAACFYFAMVAEINDETDDALESYSESILIRFLAGEPLEIERDGSNNSYELQQVDAAYALSRPKLSFRDEEIYIPVKREYEPARVQTTLFQRVDGTWYELRVSTPTFERNDLMETVLGWVVALYLVLLVTGISLTMWVFYRSMSPLYKLLAWLDRYLPGHHSEPVPNDTTITEFRRLNEATQQMADRADELYERQKQFIGNASHELQTPLAVLGNRMEWMLDSMQLNEEQMAEMIRMLHTQRHMVRLNRNLLLLTKIDNGQFPESTTLDLVTILTRETEVLAEMYEAREIRCTLSLPERFEVMMNDSLASILITNLLRNAYLHSKNRTSIEVRIEDATLTISNEGEQPLDGDRIFERFYQGSKREGSTGLGLALARAVADTYELQLTYHYADGRHHFALRFPKQS